MRGPKKHMKRFAAPKHWMLDKLTGTWAPKPSPGPHKQRECLPLIILLRNRLKYALTRREVVMILKQRFVKVDGKVRTDQTYPAGFMDVVQIERTNEHYRLLYDVKGRFVILKVSAEEAGYKLCKVRRQEVGPRGIPFIALHDSRTIRYADPSIKVNDTVKVDIATGKVLDNIKFEVGNLVMITGGRNTGRMGVITQKEKHAGGFDIVHIKDAAGHAFSTRRNNVFVIGHGVKPSVTVPRGNGVRLSVLEELERRLAK